MNEANQQDNRRRQAQLRRLSKFLSLLLRHRPARFPIEIDAEGYADLQEILSILNALPNFRWAGLKDVEAVLQMPGRRRFEIVSGRIRALYGHTAIRPTYPLVQPPYYLYHGTAPENVEAIMTEGLQSMKRQYVHLSATPDTARDIALRHTRTPIILRINAAAAYAAGIPFHQPTDQIFLADEVPPDYVETDEQTTAL